MGLQHSALQCYFVNFANSIKWKFHYEIHVFYGPKPYFFYRIIVILYCHIVIVSVIDLPKKLSSMVIFWLKEPFPLGVIT